MHVHLASFTPLQRRPTNLANLCAPGLGTSSGLWQVGVKQNCFQSVIYIFPPELQYSFFLWTSKILAWSLGCLPLLPLRKQSSSFQQLNDCSRPDVLSSTPHIWWFDGRLHFLSQCADFSRPNEKTSPLYWRKEWLGRVQRTQSADLGKRPA